MTRRRRLAVAATLLAAFGSLLGLNAAMKHRAQPHMVLASTTIGTSVTNPSSTFNPDGGNGQLQAVLANGTAAQVAAASFTNTGSPANNSFYIGPFSDSPNWSGACFGPSNQSCNTANFVFGANSGISSSLNAPCINAVAGVGNCGVSIDAAGQQIVAFSWGSASTPVNGFTFLGAATGQDLKIAANGAFYGGDSNVSIQVNPIGTGVVKIGGSGLAIGEGNNETAIKDSHWERVLIGHGSGTVASAAYVTANLTGLATCPSPTVSNTLATGSSCVCGTASPQIDGCPDGGTLGSLTGATVHDTCYCSVDSELYFLDGGASPTASSFLACDCSFKSNGSVDVQILNQSGGTIGSANPAWWVPVNIWTQTN